MSEQDKIDWLNDAAAIVIKHQPAIAVSHGTLGHVVITQEDVYGDRDDIIMVAPENAVTLCRAILKTAGVDAEIPEREPRLMLPAPAASAPKDPTAAERMRRYRNKRNGGVTEGGGHA